MQFTLVVALFLSMIGVSLCKPMGYEYPTPKVPFIEGPTMSTTSPPDIPDCVPEDLDENPYYQSLLNLGTPLCPPDNSYYDDYNPNDIPEDQAAPSNEIPGYEYPVPENPLILPTRTTTPLPLPECVLSDEQTKGSNPTFLQAGVPLCPDDYDDYDPNDIPADQAMPLPECVKADQKDSGMNKEYLNAGVPLCPSDEPAGYEYPVPDNPLTLPPKTTTTTAAAEIYDDYDPNDIPDDQAEPSGYEYPVPEIPFKLPTKLTTPLTTSTPLPLPDCVPENQKSIGPNPQFLAAGVPICPSDDQPSYQPTPPPTYDDYDMSDIPADQAEPLPDCVLSEDQNKGSNPRFIAAGVPICPSDELPGYEYPVPQNPLSLPTKPTTTVLPLPDCVKESEKNSGPNPGFIAAGVPLCPSEGYSYPVPSNPLQLPERSRKAKLVLEDDLLLIGLTHQEEDSYDPEYYDHNSPDYIDSMDGDYSEGEDERRLAVTESGISLTGRGKVFSFHVPSSFNTLSNKPKTRSKNMDISNTIIDGTLLPPRLKAGSHGDISVVQAVQSVQSVQAVQASTLSRMPKMVKDHRDEKMVSKLQIEPSQHKRLGKSLESRRNKISVQAWLRRG